MHVIQPQIIVPDNIYKDFVAGKIDIMGLAKNVDNHQVVKHLDTLNNHLDILNNNNSKSDTAAIAAGVVAIVALTTLVTGITIKFVNKAKQKKVDEFKRCLNNYIQAVNGQRLTIETIDELITAIDKLKRSVRKKIVVEFSTDELSALIECLCNHTKTLAQANNVKIDDNISSDETSDVIIRLRDNLVYQKQVFAQAA